MRTLSALSRVRGWMPFRATGAGVIVFALYVPEAMAQDAGTNVRFRFPLENCPMGCAVPSAYVDLEPDSGLRDWNCGATTYESHLGSDFGIVGGFAAQVQGRIVVAAARGVVIATHDGESDRCVTGQCGGAAQGLGNFVSLLHADGRTTHYGHLRTFSLQVSVGQQVRCGEPLGYVGSSGNSTGPHLHFEVREGSVVIDPFAARPACGAQPTSFWTEQGLYGGLPGAACAPELPDATAIATDVTPIPRDTFVTAVAEDVVDGALDDRGGSESRGPNVGCACRVRSHSLERYNFQVVAMCVVVASGMATQKRRRSSESP